MGWRLCDLFSGAGGAGRGGEWMRRYGRRPTYAEVAAAMGVEWMRGREVTEAAPPGYTALIGEMLMTVLETRQ